MWLRSLYIYIYIWISIEMMCRMITSLADGSTPEGSLSMSTVNSSIEYLGISLKSWSPLATVWNEQTYMNSFKRVNQYVFLIKTKQISKYLFEKSVRRNLKSTLKGSQLFLLGFLSLLNKTRCKEPVFKPWSVV